MHAQRYARPDMSTELGAWVGVLTNTKSFSRRLELSRILKMLGTGGFFWPSISARPPTICVAFLHQLPRFCARPPLEWDYLHETHGFVYPEAPLRLPPEAVSRPSRAGGENHPTAMPLGPGLTPACTDSYHEAHAFFYPAELLRLPPEAVLRTPPGQALRITLALRL